MTKRQRIELKIGPTGRGTLLVDGEDWSDRTRKVSVFSEVGTLTRVVVELTDVEVDFDGPGWLTTTSIVDTDEVYRPVGSSHA